MSGANWGAEKDFDGVPIPHDFFNKIERIALMIGRLLKRKGIDVAQTKEKFGSCRVYVNLEKHQEEDYRHIYLKVIFRLPDYAKYIVSGMDYPELIELENYCFACKADMPIVENSQEQEIRKCPHREIGRSK